MLLIGIDLGGTNIKAGLIDDEGNILIQNKRPTVAERGYSKILNDMADQIKELTVSYGISLNDIYSVGVGVPGIVRCDTGKVINCTNLLWNSVELSADLNSRINKKIYVENDANAAALAESLFGVTKSVSNSVLLTIGTGIGSGIIINNQIFRGSHAFGSELGHMIIGDNFYNCNCGNNGCFETLASATAIVKYVQLKIKETRYKNSQILNLAWNRPECITAKDIFDAAKLGDFLALESIDRMCKYMAIGIHNIYNILDPEIIVLGGGVSAAGNFLIDKIKEKTSLMMFENNIEYGKIAISALGNDAGIIGAAFLGSHKAENKVFY